MYKQWCKNKAKAKMFTLTGRFQNMTDGTDNTGIANRMDLTGGADIADKTDLTGGAEPPDEEAFSPTQPCRLQGNRE